jgi:hypothetical protein
MKKFQAVILALFAVSALGVVFAASASAEVTLLAEWLINAAVIPAGTTVESETTGSLLLEDNKTPFGAAAVLCSAILDGTLGPNGEDLITAVLNLAKELIGEELVGLALECEGEKLCSTPALVWPDKLPWPTLLFLMENGEFLDLVENAGYHNECTVLGIKEADLCTLADSEFPVLNDPVTGDAETPANVAATPNATCMLGGANSGVNETDELATITSPAGLVTVSSE